MDTFAERPLISVVMPTYETEPRYLREAIASVRAQEYENWELCIVDDGSTRDETLRTIKRAVSRDHRITAKLLDANGGISRATNQGPAICRGELVAFLDHDDVLTADALLRVAEAFSGDEIDVAYSDQDTITADGRTADTFLKPDWSPTYALGAMYIGHLLVARRELVSTRSAASTPATTPSRTSSCCCASPSEPSGSTTSRIRSTTGGRSRAASRSGPGRRTACPSFRRAPSTPTCGVAGSRPRRSPTRRSRTGSAFTRARAAEPR